MGSLGHSKLLHFHTPTARPLLCQARLCAMSELTALRSAQDDDDLMSAVSAESGDDSEKDKSEPAPALTDLSPSTCDGCGMTSADSKGFRHCLPTPSDFGRMTHHNACPGISAKSQESRVYCCRHAACPPCKLRGGPGVRWGRWVGKVPSMPSDPGKWSERMSVRSPKPGALPRCFVGRRRVPRRFEGVGFAA